LFENLFYLKCKEFFNESSGWWTFNNSGGGPRKSTIRYVLLRIYAGIFGTTMLKRTRGLLLTKLINSNWIISREYILVSYSNCKIPLKSIWLTFVVGLGSLDSGKYNTIEVILVRVKMSFFFKRGLIIAWSKIGKGLR
jgi:hypothetical protein